MADGDSGIGSILGLAAGANPVGGITQGVTGAISGITAAITAAQQMKRAQQLRDQANQTTTEAIRPEFLAAEKNAEGQSLYGLPALTNYQNQIGKNIAGSVRAIKESSPNGASTLAAIDNALASGNQASNDLAAKDAQAQENKATAANNTIWNVGEQQRNLENIRDKKQMALEAQAGNLETAATLNKQTGINTALTGITQGASQAFRPDQSPNTTTKNTDTISSVPTLNSITSNPNAGVTFKTDTGFNSGPPAYNGSVTVPRINDNSGAYINMPGGQLIGAKNALGFNPWMGITGQ